MNELENIAEGLQNQIELYNEQYGMSSSMSLYHLYTELLSEGGYFVDEYLVEINSTHDGICLAGFSRETENDSLNVFVPEFSNSLTIEKIYDKDVTRHFDQVKKLLFVSLNEEKEELDQGDPTTELIEDIHLRKHKFSKIRIWMLTNKLYSSRDNLELGVEIDSVKIIYNYCDLGFFQRLISNKNSSNVHIKTKLAAIRVVATDRYSSYLFSLSGIELCKYYDDYNKRLLESNIRTFLSLRGNVNKGIYQTINSEEQRPFFFAYNNGLTATASAVVFDEGFIFELKDLQIVNGGQTMSTIFKAWKDGKSIDGVYVPVKLSVIHDVENKSEFISRISRYANTQNKVTNSDFFSNSYYQKTLKELSGRILVSKGDRITKVKWFYERVRGEYLNDQTFLESNKKKNFIAEYPKNLVFDKIAVAKAYLSVNQYPHHVSKGAQLCFALFAPKVSDLYDEDNNLFTDTDYKVTIAQIILFRSFERLISSANWYSGGYRAQTVAYTIAVFVQELSEKKVTIDWDQIWNSQTVPDQMLAEIMLLGEAVHKLLINPPPGNTNIGTYTKKDICWKWIKAHSFACSSNISGVISLVIQEERKSEEKKILKELKGIHAQLKIVELAKGNTPKNILEFYNSSQAPGIKDRDRGILKSWFDGKIAFPSEVQAKIILSLIRDAEIIGFEL